MRAVVSEEQQVGFRAKLESDLPQRQQRIENSALRMPSVLGEASRVRARLHCGAERKSCTIGASSSTDVIRPRCPSSKICSRAFGMSRAMIRAFTGGTIGSSAPDITSVGCLICDNQ